MWVIVVALIAVVQAAPWWPLQTDVGLQAQAFSELTKNQNVLATCSYVLVKEYVDFDTAEQRCRDLRIGVTTTGRGNLATVNTEEKNMELSDLMKIAYGQTVTGGWRFDNSNWCWIGLRKVSNNLMSMSLSAQKKKALELKGVFTASDWAWEDGSPAIWTYWMDTQPDGKPDDNGNLQNQVRMYKKGFWDDSYGFNKHPFACDYRGKYIIVEEPKLVSEAEEACVAAGMTLAKIRSKAENAEFVEAAKLFLPNHQWSDDLPYNSTNWIWIGANDLNEKHDYEFMDGAPIEFDIPWRHNQPDHADNHGFGRHEDYVAVSVTGQWDDSYGEDRRRPFACMCPDS